MKKIIMRAPASPFENPTHKDAIMNDLINTNSGNLIFPHSIARTLMSEDVEIDFSKMNTFLTDAEIAQYNKEYDAFIIPLANAFRVSFIGQLEKLTYNIKRLDMPCVVVGVGYQGAVSGKIREKKELDEAVRNFVDAVLEKSTRLGLRGEITAEYLKKLGYVPDKDFTVIGCPSMYLYGPELPKPKPLELSEKTRINLNCKVVLPEKIHRYMHGVCEKIPDHMYVVQNLYELKTIFCGLDLTLASKDNINKNDFYPYDYSHRIYRENKIRGFVSAEAWFEFLKERDLNFGTRIHGNISGVLSGVPTFIVAPDGRVRELAEYHRIPNITIDELDESKDIFELLKDVDFNSVLDGHKERFEHYKEFLNENGLETIYDSEGIVSKFDRKINEIDFHGAVLPMPFVSYDEQLEAIDYWQFLCTDKKSRKRINSVRGGAGLLRKIVRKIRN